MKQKGLFIIICFMLLIHFSKAKISFDDVGNVKPGLGEISFKENKGQVSDQFYKPRPDILFSGTNGALVFHLKNNGISYQLSKVDKWKKQDTLLFHPKNKKQDQLIPAQKTIYRLDINWLNCNPNSTVVKTNALEGYDNYYLESCPNGALGVKSYRQVMYSRLYPGIDLKWYGKAGNLKYDFLIAANTDYKQIQLQINGAEKITINKKGEVIIKTPLGEIIEQAPLVIQNGKQLPAKWKLKNNILSFEIKNADKNLPLIIDPLVRLWGTYYGGGSDEWGYYSCSDNAGNAYMSGETKSNNNIATIGAYQTTFQGSGAYYGDAFLVKFNPAGVRQWASYYGGATDDYGGGCVADASGNIYFTGGTSCTNSVVIATPGAYQTNPSGGAVVQGLGDSFLVKFNSSGVRQWGTYYGGEHWENSWGCTLDPSGDIYMVGATSSTLGIATPGSHQTLLGGIQDGYLAKFNSSGGIIWATYYGGTGPGNEGVWDCRADVSGNIYIGGYTTASNGISTPGSHQALYGGGNGDAYLAKFSSTGLRQWSTYYGGSSVEDGGTLCIDPSGNIYLSGDSQSNNPNVISTPGSHQPLKSAFQDGFLVKFNSAGVRLWGTYYGGNGADFGWATAVDPMGNVYLGGYTNSININTGNVIATPCSYQYINGGGSDEGFLAKFDSQGVRLWGTFYGGNQNDEGYYCHTDYLGNVYLCGWTATSTGTAIADPASHQPVYGGAFKDAFLVKFNGCLPDAPNTTGPPDMIICSGNTTTLTTVLTCSINWYNSATSTVAIGTGSVFQTPQLNNNTTFYIEDLSCGTTTIRTAVDVTVNPIPSLTLTANDPVICAGQSSTLIANGASTYTWLQTPYLNSTSGFSVIATPNSNATYSVIGESNSCVGGNSVSVQVLLVPTLTVLSTNHFICIGSAVPLQVSGAQNYTWSPSGNLTSPTGSLVYSTTNVNTTYTVYGAIDVGTVTCIAEETYYINAISNAQATISANVSMCEGDDAILFVNGGDTYNWSPVTLSDPAKNVVYVSPSVTTIYTVEVSNDGYCGLSKTVMVTVNPKPVAFAGRDTVFNLKEPMFLNASGSGTLTWISGEVWCKDCPSTQIFPSRYGCYVIEAINEFGCEAKDEVCVDVANVNAVYVPNTFTPNNDGLNDNFYAYGFGLSDITLEIFDRWGTKLFVTHDQAIGWDGTYSGSKCKTDVYVYKLEYRLNDGKYKNETGHVTLAR